jgi:hypothetical protein
LPVEISSSVCSIFEVKAVSTRSGKCSSSRAVTAKAVKLGVRELFCRVA